MSLNRSQQNTLESRLTELEQRADSLAWEGGDIGKLHQQAYTLIAECSQLLTKITDRKTGEIPSTLKSHEARLVELIDSVYLGTISVLYNAQASVETLQTFSNCLANVSRYQGSIFTSAVYDKLVETLCLLTMHTQNTEFLKYASSLNTLSVNATVNNPEILVKELLSTPLLLKDNFHLFFINYMMVNKCIEFGLPVDTKLKNIINIYIGIAESKCRKNLDTVIRTIETFSIDDEDAKHLLEQYIRIHMNSINSLINSLNDELGKFADIPAEYKKQYETLVELTNLKFCAYSALREKYENLGHEDSTIDTLKFLMSFPGFSSKTHLQKLQAITRFYELHQDLPVDKLAELQNNCRKTMSDYLNSLKNNIALMLDDGTTMAIMASAKKLLGSADSDLFPKKENENSENKRKLADNYRQIAVDKQALLTKSIQHEKQERKAFMKADSIRKQKDKELKAAENAVREAKRVLAIANKNEKKFQNDLNQLPKMDAINRKFVLAQNKESQARVKLASALETCSLKDQALILLTQKQELDAKHAVLAADLQLHKAKEQLVQAEFELQQVSKHYTDSIETEKLLNNLIPIAVHAEISEAKYAMAIANQNPSLTDYLEAKRNEVIELDQQINELEMALNYILQHGKGKPVAYDDIDKIKRLNTELLQKGLTIEVSGSLAAVAIITYFNKICDFTVQDIDLSIPWLENNDFFTDDNIAIFRNAHGFVTEVRDGTTYINARDLEASHAPLDLSIIKSKDYKSYGFLPFHFCHLVFIDEEKIQAHDRIIRLHGFTFKIIIDEHQLQNVIDAAKFQKFIIQDACDGMKKYFASTFKFAIKLENCIEHERVVGIINDIVNRPASKAYLLQRLEKEYDTEDNKVFFTDLMAATGLAIENDCTKLLKPISHLFLGTLLQYRLNLLGISLHPYQVHAIAYDCMQEFHKMLDENDTPFMHNPKQFELKICDMVSIHLNNLQAFYTSQMHGMENHAHINPATLFAQHQGSPQLPPYAQAQQVFAQYQPSPQPYFAPPQQAFAPHRYGPPVQPRHMQQQSGFFLPTPTRKTPSKGNAPDKAPGHQNSPPYNSQ